MAVIDGMGAHVIPFGLGRRRPVWNREGPGAETPCDCGQAARSSERNRDLPVSDSDGSVLTRRGATEQAHLPGTDAPLSVDEPLASNASWKLSRDDEEQWKRFLGTEAKKWRGYARRHRIIDYDELEDVIAETIARGYLSSDSYRRDGRPEAYLMRICARLVADLDRRHHRWWHQEAVSEDNLESIADGASKRDEEAEVWAVRAAAVDEAMATLKPRERQILQWRMEGQRFSEIGRRLQITEATAAVAGGRAILAIRLSLAARNRL